MSRRLFIARTLTEPVDRLCEMKRSRPELRTLLELRIARFFFRDMAQKSESVEAEIYEMKGAVQIEKNRAK